MTVVELAKKLEKAEARAAELKHALDPFTFKAAPTSFMSQDGGMSDALICDSDVQLARQALSGDGSRIMDVVRAARKVRSIAKWIESHSDKSEDAYSCAIDEMKAREMLLDEALDRLGSNYSEIPDSSEGG